VPDIGLSFAYAPASRVNAADLDALWRVYASFFDTQRAAFDEAVRRAERLACLCPLNARNVAAIAWTGIRRLARRTGASRWRRASSEE
jgi:hypothetical protein